MVRQKIRLLKTRKSDSFDGAKTASELVLVKLPLQKNIYVVGKTANDSNAFITVEGA